MRQFGMDLDSAVAWAARYHDEIKAKFIDLFQKVPSFGEAVDKDLRLYLDGVACWPRAHHSWCYESGRYFGSKGLEYQRTHMIALLPKIEKFRDQNLHRENVMVPYVDQLEDASAGVSHVVFHFPVMFHFPATHSMAHTYQDRIFPMHGLP